MNKQTGFTLLEVLISVLIFSMGLLGLASLQVTGQRSNQSAYFRSQAMLQAYDMSDRMRANPDGISSNAYNSIPSSTPPTQEPSCISSSGGCTPAQLATYDEWQWNSMNSNLLPSGTGTITLNDSDSDGNYDEGETFTISVIWDDNRDGSVSTANGDPEFSIEFEP